MGWFDFLKRPDINEGVKKYQETEGALLVDVRTAEEVRLSKIPGSINISLAGLQRIRKVAKKMDTPLFVYCASGSRSAQAVSALKRMGYTDVTNIGGIYSYKGKVEQS